jgi:hypothetical protein
MPACTKSCGPASNFHTWKVCSRSTASDAIAAWKYTSRPRVMRPAAASDTSRITPRPLLTPPLACISMTIAKTSTITPAVTWMVRFGSRSRAGMSSISEATVYATMVGSTGAVVGDPGAGTPRLKKRLR